VATEIHRITQETLDKLRAEYEELTTVGRVAIARTIEAARLLGDLSENGDYHAAKDDQGKMEARIRHIDTIIRNHEIVEKDQGSSTVTYASVASIVYEGDPRTCSLPRRRRHWAKRSSVTPLVTRFRTKRLRAF
jgi:transcription elongation factor GreA